MNAKRPAEETIPEIRRTRIKLASPSPERTSASDTESIHSWQGYKTEVANDTSDTSSPDIPQPYTEYEITDPTGEKLKFYYSEDSLEEDDVKNEFFNRTSSDSFDIALLGDTSEENSTSPTSNSDVDPGLPRNDYLDFENCILCKTDKKNISYPYCTNCFTWKKNLFPSRPKRRKKGFKNYEIQSRSVSKGGLQILENKSNLPEERNKQGSLSDGLFEDSGMGSTEQTQLSEDTVDGPSQPSTSSSTEILTLNSSNTSSSVGCRVCFVKPEDGLFVHLKSAHRYGCYSCAKEIWYHNGGCPLCRRKVFKEKSDLSNILNGNGKVILIPIDLAKAVGRMYLVSHFVKELW